MELARSKQGWPLFILPQDRGRVTASRVMTAPAGPERDQMIDEWCRSVWDAYREDHEKVVDLLSRGGWGAALPLNAERFAGLSPVSSSR